MTASEMSTVDTLITHTPRENPQIMGYDGLCPVRTPSVQKRLDASECVGLPRPVFAQFGSMRTRADAEMLVGRILNASRSI